MSAVMTDVDQTITLPRHTELIASPVVTSAKGVPLPTYPDVNNASAPLPINDAAPLALLRQDKPATPTTENRSVENVDMTGVVATTRPKKKKKRKNGQQNSTSSTSALASETSSERSADGLVNMNEDTIEQWTQRVQSLRAELAKARKEKELVESDMAAALARANDAEQAESVANKGLLTARSVIAQRDRALGELNGTLSSIRAEVAQLSDEKGKMERRLQLLKTVSANLQEARECRDHAERKLGDASSVNSALSRQVRELDTQVGVMGMLKQQLARLETDLESMTVQKKEAEQRVGKASVGGMVIGVAGTLVCGLTARVLRGNSKED